MAAAAKPKPAARLERIAEQREQLESRSGEVERRLRQLPDLEAAARFRALQAGGSTYRQARALAEERAQLEAELGSNRQDLESLAVEERELRAALADAQAARIGAEAEPVRVRQQERLAQAGRLVRELAELWPELVADERTLAGLRAQATGTLGHPRHSHARPVLEPFPVSRELWLDLAVWAATTDAARGRWGDSRKAAGPALLEAVPDLRDRDAELVRVDDLTPYSARVLAVLPS